MIVSQVTLEEVLDARERRAQLQHRYLEQYAVPVVSFTMNIAGPVKTNPRIRRVFEHGRTALEQRLQAEGCRIVRVQTVHGKTGDEALYAVDGSAGKLKEICTAIEDGFPAGRLYDMDVIGTDGVKLSREKERSCIVCGRAGRYCASRRIHSTEELQKATERLICTAFEEEDGKWIGNLCVNALQEEALTTPKPGLVDRNNNGSHRDMTLSLLMKSADSLRHYFTECFAVGRAYSSGSPGVMFPVLREAGIRAERVMLEATCGVNTHKGAVFHFGLLCGSAGYLYRGVRQYSIDELCSIVQSVCADALAEYLKSLPERTELTHGEAQYIKSGITGARGEATSGYRSVRTYGLPVFERVLAGTGDREQAGVQALLSLIAHTEDTNMMHRGGWKTAGEIASALRERLQAGEPVREEILALDEQFIRLNLSPGGSADLLGVTYLLHDLGACAEE